MVEEWYLNKTRRRITIAFLLVIGIMIGVFINILYDLSTPPKEKMSPQSRIHRSQIQLYDDRVVINMKDAMIYGFADTNSMDPVLDSGMKGIAIRPRSRDDIQVGDLISFNKNSTSITHRVIEKGWDNEDWYILTKGDNNRFRDFWKVRYTEINAVQIGVIY